MMSMPAVLALKQRLAEVTGPAPVPSNDPSTALSTGVPALDAKIGGGLPRGRLTEILGPRGAGKTTFIRHVVLTAATRATWIAYIDAARTLAPRDWVDVARATSNFWIIRPPTPSQAAWSADVLLRSGTFGLVILDGAPTLTRAITVRLTTLARASDAALVALGDDDSGWRASALGSPLRLRVRGGAAHLTVTPEPHSLKEVPCALPLAHRLCPDPTVPDRRGVAPPRHARR
jgi:hypothetical protein